MRPADAPALILGCTVLFYWCCVGGMVVRVRRDAKRIGRVLIPAQRAERLMWVVWVPVVLAWIALPLLASMTAGAGNGLIGLPAIAVTQEMRIVRSVAAALAVICLLASIWCWRHMGRHWRMGVDPSQTGKLFTDGPFACVRHPIYALSIALMMFSTIVVPSPVLIFIGVTHITLMHVKARNEERFLLDKYGAQYQEYCRSTGRFIPSRAWRP